MNKLLSAAVLTLCANHAGAVAIYERDTQTVSVNSNEYYNVSFIVRGDEYSNCRLYARVFMWGLDEDPGHQGLVTIKARVDHKPIRTIEAARSADGEYVWLDWDASEGFVQQLRRGLVLRVTTGPQEYASFDLDGISVAISKAKAQCVPKRKPKNEEFFEQSNESFFNTTDRRI